ncbi:MAG: mannose-1-phosphate guanylyltransferase/mannose-6-phosphate isomerase [Pseudomonadota bacterium]
MVSQQNILPVLLCGGSGSRLWPISRQLYPKQLIPLGTQHPLVIDTAQRFQSDTFLPPLIICNEDHRFLVSSLLKKNNLERSGIILEPFGRNTAPAAVIAALFAKQKWPEQPPLIMLVPSDHLIKDHMAFHGAIEKAASVAQSEKLMTFGIKPSHPETGYGYIKCAKSLENIEQCYEVEQFVEKPNKDTAQVYVNSGGYLWNSGMFLFAPEFFLEETKYLAPEVAKASETAFTKAQQDSSQGFIRLDETAFKACPNISIDYAIMEKTKHAAVVSADFDWSDIGSWDSIWQESQKTEDGNVKQGEVITLDTQGSYIQSHVLTAVVGLDNVVVIATEDAILVMDREHSQKVKNIVEELKATGREEYYSHKEVYRPWGSYNTLALGDRYQVKEICVYPGASLSLQYHHHRAEHWVVVEGTAEVTRGEDVFMISENQSTYIPLGETHRLTNPGKTKLKLIEVQSGSYLGEDDIVRIDDVYNRV